ncbi:MAG: HAD family hydrolase [Chloroflexi bacterium]|nr:HAD family hydrolase [Chloroflexota bacterium]
MNDSTKRPQPDDETPQLHEQLSPGMEALSLEELDEFMKRAKSRAANFTPAQRQAVAAPEVVEEVTVSIAPERLAGLLQNFYPELPADSLRPRRLVQGVILDFDNTLARLKQPIAGLMESGARQAEVYMRSTGMEFPENFWKNIVEARIFAQTKSDDEQEEHVADDALSFLLQFFGYPASRMDGDVLRRAVDIFYAPEMTAWEAMPGALDLLGWLNAEGYKVALIANYACDRVFQRIVDYTGLRPFLDVCLCSGAVEWRKPGREIYESVLKRWDAEPYELVCVGDSLKHDIAGGLQLGALTVHCRLIPLAEDQRIVDAISPDKIIDDLAQLPPLIQAWAE